MTQRQDYDYTIGWRAVRDGKELPPGPTKAMLAGAEDTKRAIASGRDITWSRPPQPRNPQDVHNPAPGRARVLTAEW